MGHLGFSELLFIMAIALLVLGPKRMPEVGRTLGRTLAELKRATSGLQDSIQREMKNAAEEAKRAAAIPGSQSDRPNQTEAGTKPDAPKS